MSSETKLVSIASRNVCYKQLQEVIKDEASVSKNAVTDPKSHMRRIFEST